MLLLSARGFALSLIGMGLLLGLVDNSNSLKCLCFPESSKCQQDTQDCADDEHCTEVKSGDFVFKGCKFHAEFMGAKGCKDIEKDGKSERNCWCDTDLCNKNLLSGNGGGGKTPGTSGPSGSNAGSTMNISLIPVIASGLLGIGPRRISLS